MPREKKKIDRSSKINVVKKKKKVRRISLLYKPESNNSIQSRVNVTRLTTPTMVTSIVCIIFGVIFYFQGTGPSPSAKYYFSLSIILLGMGIYLLFVMLNKYLKNIEDEKKIEFGILLLSVLILFSTFYINWYSQSVVILNEFSPIYYDYHCPIFTNQNETFNMTVLNSDLTKGIGVNLGFIGKGICFRTGNECKEKMIVYQNPVIILAGNNYTFSMPLTRVLKKSIFYIDSYNIFGWRIARIKC